MTKPGYHQMQGMIVRSFVGDMSQNCAWLQMIRDLRKHNAHGSIQMNEHRWGTGMWEQEGECDFSSLRVEVSVS